MHNTHCCGEGVDIAITFCSITKRYRVRGQWNPAQMSLFEDAVHDVEIVVDEPDQIRSAVVQVYTEFSTLLRLSPLRADA